MGVAMAAYHASDSFLSVSVGLEDLGLSRSNARAVSQTVLPELVQNAPGIRMWQPDSGSCAHESSGTLVWPRAGWHLFYG
jgi:hypothetical protein